jgi:hypothetical protein
VSVINQIPLTINAYGCLKCGKWHKKGSKLFTEHYASTFDDKGKWKGRK